MDKQLLIDKIVETQAVVRQAKKSYYSQNFYEFNRDILGWPDIYEPLHRMVCDFIHDNIGKKKILLLLPRGTFKSSIVTIGYSLYRIANDPQERILIANATYPMATQFLSQIKNHLTRNERFINIFGDLSQSADSWREDRIFVSREKSYEQKEPTVWAQGTQGNATGSHFSLAILDDVVARDNVGTKDQIEKVKNYYRDVMDLVDPNPNGVKNIILVGTTWHYDDLYSWILGKESNLAQDFAVLRLPAYEGEWGKGNLLFPDKLSWKTLDELKRSQGNSHFAAQYMLDPILAEDAVFKAKFKYYEESDIRGLRLNKFITVDPALSEKKDADYSAMVCVGVDHHNDWYILDVWREKVNPKRLIDQIFYWNDKWKPISFGVEFVAFQRVLQFYLQDEMRKRNKSVPLKEIHYNEQSKDERIRALEPRYEMGSIFHNHDLAQMEYLEDELRRFPKGGNDDIIDALASQLEVAFPVRQKEERHTIYRGQYPA